MLTLRLLGSPSFWVNGTPLTGLRYPQGRKLLAYLALQKGRPVERAYLAGLFWPETDPAQALFYLRRTLSDLRKALGPESTRLLSPTPRTLALNLEGAECDLARGASGEGEGEILQGWTDDWVLAARQARQSAKPAIRTTPRLLGRDELLKSTLALLDTAPVVTLTGPGGVGKTRLARAVVQSLQATGAGVGFVSLASLPPAIHLESTLEELWHTLATALDIPQAALATQLKRRSTLVVLDNCEQVCAACAALITALPGVRFLATSRIPLGCQGEQPLAVPPLELDVAATLFREHAAALGVTCPRDARDARDATVEAICQSVDCLPLAIELAASRLTLMSAAQLRERLGTPLRLLRRSQTSPAEIPRQATLEATIQWSYSLLPEPERLAFIRLGVFQGEWGLEAAEAVLETLDADTLLESLVRQSLLVVSRTASGEPRFHFLETIRAFARSQCAEPAYASAARAHAHYFYALAQCAHPEQREGVQQLEASRREFAAALAWFEINSPVTGIALMLVLETFWVRLSGGFPSHTCLTRLMSAAGNDLSLPQRIQAQRLLAALTLEYSEAQRLLIEAHALALQHALERERGYCLLALCLLEKQRNADAVRRYAQEAHACFTHQDDLAGQTYALEYLAVAALCQGKLSEAEQGYTQFLVLARQLESHIITGDALYGLAQVLIFQERYSEAEPIVHEALGQMPDEMGQANVRYLLGELARHTGQPTAALAHYTEALRLCHDNMIHVLPAFIERSRAIVLASQKDFAAAWASVQAALVEFRCYRIGAQLGSTLAEMAWIAHREGKPREAQAFFEQAAQAPPRDIRHPRDEARLQIF
jgi:predicted ATPase/tetratricopeptide (TPR) repeat protein